MPHDPSPIDPSTPPRPSVPERRARYAEQFRRPEWQRRRDAILGRDGRRCRQCGAGHDLRDRRIHGMDGPEWRAREALAAWRRSG